MNHSPEPPKPPNLLVNSILIVVGLMAHMPLYYQLPRWANGLDPTFVHPQRFAESPFPAGLYLATVHPVIWMTLIALIFIRLCRSYGWRFSR